MDERRYRRVLGAIAIAAVVATMATGLMQRLADPISSPVIPAEDPYTHMALVREHIRDGSLDPLNDGGHLYPPGLHAYLAAAWTFTGLDLYDIVRFGPVALGVMGILGVAMLLWRYGGPTAAFVGALAIATAPEIIFRTTMMSPTAMDIAVLPFFLYALIESMRGRMAWLAIAIPISLFFVLAHPWIFGVLAAAGAAFVLLALVLPWRQPHAPPMALRGLLAAMAVVSGGFALAASGCAGSCGPGFLSTTGTSALGPVPSSALGPVAFVATLVLVAAVLWLPKRLRMAEVRNRSKPIPVWMRASLSVSLVAALVLVTIAAKAGGMPPYVDLPRMFGWPILVLAAAGLAAIPFLPNPAAHMGGALAIATYPFVVFNPFDSPFWSHRTAVYLGIGLVLLVGVAAAAVARGVAIAWALRTTKRAKTEHIHRHWYVPALVAAVALGGSIFIATPPEYPGGWYRLYNGCELEALEEVSDYATADADIVVITGDYRPKLVLAALTPDGSRVWLSTSFFQSGEYREDLMATFANQGKPIVVVVDRYTTSELPGEQGFLEDGRWTQIGSWCSGMGVQAPRVEAYVMEVRQ